MKRIALLVACLVGFSTFAEKTTHKTTTTTTTTEETQGNMDPKMQELMKQATPSEGHKLLKDLSGKWSYTMKSWMEPDAKPEVATGTSTNKLIMEGRFLQQDVTGKAMGKPFHGEGTIGFNNMKGEYETSWIDNMSTGMMRGTGTFDATTNTITETGSFSCPLTQEKERSYRSETKFIGKNAYTMEMYAKGPDGKEFKMMELNYKKIQ